MLIELQFDFLQLVLKTLLQDKNTGKNIIWATDDYKKYGPEYFSDCEMTSYNVNALDINVLQPRVTKSKEVQKERTKGKAEVFTPSWICENMNTYCDLDWFDIRKKDKDGKIKFIFNDKKNIKGYIDLKKLEITCGEAPFVISRYDTTTGKLIPLYKRIGFLDRKLMAISQYIEDKEEWLKLIYRAYESSYGYEYQGDNLLKARINLFYTFIDYYEKKWNMFPMNSELKKIATIITRNFWQMDGLTYTVPNTNIECKVYNWRSKKNMNIIGEGSMKFDYIIGNPPYQEMGNNKKLYPLFYVNALSMGECVEMIFPTAWQEPKNTNGLQLTNTKEIKEDRQIVFIEMKNGVFEGVAGAEKTNIVLWKHGYDNGLDGKQRIKEDGCEDKIVKLLTDTADIQKPMEFEELFKCVKNKGGFVSLKTATSVRKPYGFATDVAGNEIKYNLEKMQINRELDTDIKLLCKKNVVRFLPMEYVLPRKTIAFAKYKVFVPNAWGNLSENYIGGAYADIVIAKPYEICSETYIESGCFDNIDMAHKHAKFLMTKFCRALLYLKKFSLLCVTSWDCVPLQDYSEDWWDLSIEEIDKELMKKYNVPKNIEEFVNENIQPKTLKNIINY